MALTMGAAPLAAIEMVKRAARSPGAPMEAVSMLPDAVGMVRVLEEEEKTGSVKVGTEPPTLEVW